MRLTVDLRSAVCRRHSTVIVVWLQWQFMLLGILACLDTFLHNFTLLPLRFVVSLFSIVYRILRWGSRALRPPPVYLSSPFVATSTAVGRRAAWLLRRRRKIAYRVEVYTLLRGAIIIISYYCLTTVELSRVYHYIRGEAIIKLYVIFNILEVWHGCTVPASP